MNFHRDEILSLHKQTRIHDILGILRFVRIYGCRGVIVNFLIAGKTIPHRFLAIHPNHGGIIREDFKGK